MITTMNWADYSELVASALREDLGEAGDVTTLAIFDDQQGAAELVSKDEGVLAGSELVREVYRRLDPGLRVQFICAEGERFVRGDRIARLEGTVTALLAGERVAINFLSFLSGIAGATRRYVDAVASAGAPVPQILDTRKTLPGYRALSKYAVTIGGGANHRAGLYDMVLIKDNHIDFAGSIGRAVQRVRDRWGNRFRIEVECRTLDEVRGALAAGADLIMLDNMEIETIAAACELVRGGAQIEVSGNIDLERVAQRWPPGVDFISIGRITHSVTATDFSLKMVAADGVE